MKELAPSSALRRWFAHDPSKWAEFQRRYKLELRTQSVLLDKIAQRALRGRVTLVYGASDEAHNDAVVLSALIQRRMSRVRKAKRIRP